MSKAKKTRAKASSKSAATPGMAQGQIEKLSIAGIFPMREMRQLFLATSKPTGRQACRYAWQRQRPKPRPDQRATACLQRRLMVRSWFYPQLIKKAQSRNQSQDCAMDISAKISGYSAKASRATVMVMVSGMMAATSPVPTPNSFGLMLKTPSNPTAGFLVKKCVVAPTR